MFTKFQVPPNCGNAYQYVDDDTDHMQEISRTYHPKAIDAEISEIKDGIYRRFWNYIQPIFN